MSVGCHFAWSLDKARRHWGSPAYPDRARGDAYLRLIDFIEAEARARGWLDAAAARPTDEMACHDPGPADDLAPFQDRKLRLVNALHSAAAYLGLAAGFDTIAQAVADADLRAWLDRLGVEVHYNMKTGLKDVDIVMMLRLQTERMQGSFVPSISEYFRFFGLDHEKLKVAKPDALIMHPGPMNRGVEIDSEVADDLDRSVIHEQVEMGVAVRMACLEALIGGHRNQIGAVA